MAKVDAGPKGVVVSFHQDSFAQPAALVDFLQGQGGAVILRPDHKLVCRSSWQGARERVRGVRKLLDQLAQLAD